jgi:hypothetical protein
MKLILLLLFSSTIHTASPAEPVPANVFVDKDGDTITILDDYIKDYGKKIFNYSKKRYGTYIAVEGDSFEVISKKLYGSSKKVSELLILNELTLKDSTIQPGIKLKYIISDE